MGVGLLFLVGGCSSSGGNNGTGNPTGSGSGGFNSSGSGGFSLGSGSGGFSLGSGSGGSTDTGGSTGNGGSPGDGGSSGSTGSGGVLGKGGSTGVGGGNPGAGGSNPGAGGSNPGTGGQSSGTGGSAAVPSSVVVSSTSGYWMSGTLTTVTSGNANVTVNDTQTAQTWSGFGGAFNEIGWNVMQSLSQSDRDTVIQALFGTNGAHFSVGRIPIGASDYAVERYTEDETANDSGTLPGFSISRDMMYLIPYIKAAQAVNPNIHFWASPWTPPTWMKTTSGSVNGATCALQGKTMFDGGCMNATTANLTAYAQYFVNFVNAYSAQGIKIDYVAPQNEPNYALGYPSCLWNSSDYAKFVGQYLGPALKATSTQLMLGTNSNGDSGKDTTVVTSVMGDATAKTFPKVIGLQWAMLDNYESNSSMYKGYGIPVWATEHKCGNYPWNPSGSPKYVEPAPNDQAYGVESWGYLSKAIRAGVTAYNAWNMVLDTMGKGNDMTRQWAQDALIVVDTSGKTFRATPAYTVAIGGKKLQFAMPGQGWATINYTGN